ncbi:MAG: hypothetical protein C5B51_07050 [Terriglobia bacterium]|nr:MAG: hypothetical protein C5B51_07050 [Terriglobia bacterium]
MRIWIRNFNAVFQPAILLAATANRIRAAIPGRDDAVEFQHVNGQWFGESDEPVEIDFDFGEEQALSPFATDFALAGSRDYRWVCSVN